MSIWNPYVFTPTGQPVPPSAPPALRVHGQASAAQITAARAVFHRFCSMARLSAAPNPCEIGRLPDGSSYRITVIGPVTTLELWPVGGSAAVEFGPGLWFADPNDLPTAQEHTFFVLVRTKGRWGIVKCEGWPALPKTRRGGNAANLGRFSGMLTGCAAPTPAGYLLNELVSANSGSSRGICQYGGAVTLGLEDPTTYGIGHFVGFDPLNGKRARLINLGVGGWRIASSQTRIDLPLDQTGKLSGVTQKWTAAPPSYPSTEIAPLADIRAAAGEPDLYTLIPFNQSGDQAAVRVAGEVQTDTAPENSSYYALRVAAEPFYWVQRTSYNGVEYAYTYTTADSTYYRNQFKDYRAVIKVVSLATGGALSDTTAPADEVDGRTLATKTSVGATHANKFARVQYSGPYLQVSQWAPLTRDDGSVRGVNWTTTLAGPVTSRVTSKFTTYDADEGYFFFGSYTPSIAKREFDLVIETTGTVNGVASGTELADPLYGMRPMPTYPSTEMPPAADSGDYSNTVDANFTVHLTRVSRYTIPLGKFGSLVSTLERTAETSTISSRNTTSNSNSSDVTAHTETSEQTSFNWTYERRSIIAVDPDFDLLCYAEFTFGDSDAISHQYSATISRSGGESVSKSTTGAKPAPAAFPPTVLKILCNGALTEIRFASMYADDPNYVNAIAALHPLMGGGYNTPAASADGSGSIPFASYATTTEFSYAFPFSLRAVELGGEYYWKSFSQPADGPVLNDGTSWRPDVWYQAGSARGGFAEVDYMRGVRAVYRRLPDNSGAYLCVSGPPVEKGPSALEVHAFVVDSKGLRTLSQAGLNVRDLGLDLMSPGSF